MVVQLARRGARGARRVARAGAVRRTVHRVGGGVFGRWRERRELARCALARGVSRVVQAAAQQRRHRRVVDPELGGRSQELARERRVGGEARGETDGLVLGRVERRESVEVAHEHEAARRAAAPPPLHQLLRLAQPRARVGGREVSDRHTDARHLADEHAMVEGGREVRLLERKGPARGEAQMVARRALEQHVVRQAPRLEGVAPRLRELAEGGGAPAVELVESQHVHARAAHPRADAAEPLGLGNEREARAAAVAHVPLQQSQRQSRRGRHAGGGRLRRELRRERRRERRLGVWRHEPLQPQPRRARARRVRAQVRGWPEVHAAAAQAAQRVCVASRRAAGERRRARKYEGGGG
eukprot:scaffold118718_cov66-Phaeocystis_antarctica.AAC.4